MSAATPTTATASAPARVNLIGEHSDYNGGEVLPMAIERRTTVTVRALPNGGRSRAESATQRGIGEFDVHHVERTGHWWDYVAGVAREMRAMRVDVPQLDIRVASDVPAGAGLSSSAAIEVATAAAVNALTGAAIPNRELARLAWRVETQFVGVACGIMDQFASALGRVGHALHVWCDTEETEHVPVRETVLIFDTATTRSLRSSEFNQRRAECDEALALIRRAFPEVPDLAHATVDQLETAALPDVLHRRALHVIQEQRRVREVVEALEGGERIPGHLLYESHESLRTLYECSSPELDWFVDHVSRHEGVHGARLTGAGWGGCAIAMGEDAVLRALGVPLSAEYEKQFGRTPRVWISRAAGGVEVS